MKQVIFLAFLFSFSSLPVNAQDKTPALSGYIKNIPSNTAADKNLKATLKSIDDDTRPPETSTSKSTDKSKAEEKAKPAERVKPDKPQVERTRKAGVPQ